MIDFLLLTPLKFNTLLTPNINKKIQEKNAKKVKIDYDVIS